MVLHAPLGLKLRFLDRKPKHYLKSESRRFFSETHWRLILESGTNKMQNSLWTTWGNDMVMIFMYGMYLLVLSCTCNHICQFGYRIHFFRCNNKNFSSGSDLALLANLWSSFCIWHCEASFFRFWLNLNFMDLVEACKDNLPIFQVQGPSSHSLTIF